MRAADPLRTSHSVSGRGVVVALSLAACVTLVTFFALAQGAWQDPHGRSGRCWFCHEGPPPVGLGAPSPRDHAGGGGRYPLLDPRETAICGRCHRIDEQQTHPFEIRPTFPMPDGWPLDPAGQLVCSTCHDPHLATRFGAAGGQSLLRGNLDGELFCQACHNRAAAWDVRDIHILALDSAHRGGEDREGPSWGTIDPLSVRCLGCHDGATASNVLSAIGRSGASFGLTSNHPIGMNYRRAAGARVAMGGSSDLRPVALLDRRIRLFDGKVGCGSCHNLYAEAEDFLVVDPREGEVCRFCHDL